MLFVGAWQLKRELEWVRKQPQGRQAKSKSRVDAFFNLKSRVDNPARAASGSVTLTAASTRLGDSILKFNGACLAFHNGGGSGGDGGGGVNGSSGQETALAAAAKVILDDFSYDFEKGDRVGIVGPNGVGEPHLQPHHCHSMLAEQTSVTKDSSGVH